MADPFESLFGAKPGDASVGFPGATPLAGIGDPADSELSPEERAWLVGSGTPNSTPSSSPTLPTSQHGPLRRAWEWGTSPLRALAGLTGGSAASLLRFPFPEAYSAAHEELARTEAGRAGGGGVLGEAASLPGVGDVAAQALSPEFKESTVGRVVEPVSRLGLNILGDPLTYVGGLGAYTRVGRAAGALGEAHRTVEALNAAGKTAEAAEVAARIPTLAGAMAEAAGLEAKTPSALERVASVVTPGSVGRAVAEGNVGRVGLSLPFSPLVGIAYAPEIVEGVATQAGQSFEDLRAGRYAEAAASGTGALLTAGLGALVARGVMHEAQAAGVLERAMRERLGEPAPEPRPTIRPPIEGEAAEAPVAPRGETIITPPPTPEVPPVAPPAVPPEAAPGPPPAEPAPPPLNLEPTPGSEKIRISRTAENDQKLSDIVASKSQAGQYLTKRDLLDAGLVTPKQAKSYPLEALLDALGGTHFRSRLEPVTGFGFRVRAEASGAPSAGIEVAPAPVAPEAPAAPVVPTAAPTAAPPAVPPSAPPPPVPARTPRAEIDRQLTEQPELRSMVERTLADVAARAGVPLDSLNRTHVQTAFPGDEQKPVRALLMRSLEAGKAARRIQATQGGLEGLLEGPQPALTFPGEMRQPKRTPGELLGTRIPASGVGGPFEPSAPEGGLREPTGIGEPAPPAPAPEPAIRTQAELDAARNELRSLNVFVLAHPHVRDEFAPDIIRLEDNVMEALRRGVGTPPMETPARAPAPEQPEPQPYTGTGPAHAPRPLTPEPVISGTHYRPEAIARYERQTPGMRAEAFVTAINKHLATEGTDPAVFASRARDLMGVERLDQLTPDQLSLLFTLADKNPKGYGGTTRQLDPQLSAEATRRLTGGTSHLGPDSPVREFLYDPASPAGGAQDYARKLESSYGVPAEQNLQDTMVKWMRGLEQNDERFLTQGAAKVEGIMRQAADAGEQLEAAGNTEEAVALRQAAVDQARDTMARAQRRFESARNLRNLLLGPETPEARAELSRLLRRSVLNQAIDYGRRETRNSPIDDLVRRSQTGDLTAEEAARLTVRPEEAGVTGEALQPPPASATVTTGATGGGAGDESATVPTLPERPADVKPSEWAASIKADPDLLARVTQAISGASKAGGRGIASERMTVLRKLAADVGLDVSPKTPAEKLVGKLAKIFRAEPQAASRFLSDRLVAESGPRYAAAISRGTPIADSGTRVVDFEGDAVPFVRPLATSSGPLAETLSPAVHDLATHIGLSSRFSGLAASPQMDGLRMPDGSVFLNPLHARFVAASKLADSGLTGDALRTATSYEAARHMTNIALHEIAHAEALGHGGDFISAYADATRRAAPVYGETIRRIRDGLEASEAGHASLMPDYTRSVDALKERMTNAGTVEGFGAGPGGGGAAAYGNRPGPGAGGLAGGAEAGLQPGGAVRGGGEGEAAAVRAGALPVEGVAGGGAGVPGEAGGAGGGAAPAAPLAPRPGNEPSASLTTTLAAGLRDRQRNDVLTSVFSRFAQDMARSAGKPEDAQNYLRDLEAIKTLPEEARAQLMRAKPGGFIDIGINNLKYLGLSDEQREQIGLAYMLRNHMFSRAEPMKNAEIRDSFAEILDSSTPEQFIDMAKAKGLRDPADFAFLRAVAATFGQDVDSARAMQRAAAIDLQSPNSAIKAEAEQRASLAESLLGHSLVKRDRAIFALIPETTRVARVLQSLRMMAEPLQPGEVFRSRFFGAMRASGIKKEKADQLYQMFADLAAQGPGANPTQFVNAFRRATEPRFFDKFLEFWKAGLLGIPTQIVNISGNAMFLGLRNAESATSNLLSRLFSGLTGKPRERFVGETSARMLGGLHGFGEAWGDLKGELGDMARLRAPDPFRKLATGSFFDDPNFRQLYGAIGGKTGEFIRIPFKLLDTFDNFFKHIIRNQEWGAQANRLAQSPTNWSHGAEGASHATSRIYGELRRAASDPFSGLLKKPGYKAALEAGHKAAIQDTFQEALVGNPLRDAARSYQRATNQLPALQLLTPFMKTPYNLLAEAMKRTPIAGAWAIKKYMSGQIDQPRFVEDVVKSGIGTLGMMAVFQAALNGTVTGSGPADPKEVELLKRTGWQPNSIKLGDQYLSYRRLDPTFSVLMGTAADMAEAYARKDTDTASKLLEKGVLSFNNNILDQTFLSGLSNLIDILSDPERKGLAAIRSLKASLVPNIIGVVPFAHAARGIDPYYRETSGGFFDPMQAQVPFASTLLPEQLTPTGEPRERKGTPLERVFSPLQRSEVQTGPIAEAAAEIARVGPALSPIPPFFRVGQDTVYYTPEERQEIALAQQRAIERVGALIQSPGYQLLPDQKELATAGQRTKRDAIEAVIERYHGPVQHRINRQAMRRAKLEQVAGGGP